MSMGMELSMLEKIHWVIQGTKLLLEIIAHDTHLASIWVEVGRDLTCLRFSKELDVNTGGRGTIQISSGGLIHDLTIHLCQKISPKTFGLQRIPMRTSPCYEVISHGTEMDL